MAIYTTADFITDVEESVVANKVSDLGRKVLLRDMADIVTKINECYRPSLTNITFIGDNAAVMSFGYIRTYYSTGVIASEEWDDEEGDFDRSDDNPAIIHYYENGNVKSEEWFSNGNEHRDHGSPAKIVYHKNGTVVREEYYVHGLQQEQNRTNVETITVADPSNSMIGLNNEP